MFDVFGDGLSVIFTIIILVIEMFGPLLFFIIFIFTLKRIFKASSNVRKIQQDIFKPNVIHDINNLYKTLDKRTEKDIMKDKLEKMNVDSIDELKDYLFDIFEKFENAYSDLDYNAMKELCDKELYTYYKTGIDVNNKLGKKKYIRDIKKEKMSINNFYNTSVSQIASTIIEVSFISYTLDKEGNVVGGSMSEPTKEKYEIVYKKEFEKEKDTYKCPNCGANVEGYKCNFCDSTIKENSFKLKSIRKIVNE